MDGRKQVFLLLFASLIFLPIASSQPELSEKITVTNFIKRAAITTGAGVRHLVINNKKITAAGGSFITAGVIACTGWLLSKSFRTPPPILGAGAVIQPIDDLAVNNTTVHQHPVQNHATPNEPRLNSNNTNISSNNNDASISQEPLPELPLSPIGKNDESILDNSIEQDNSQRSNSPENKNYLKRLTALLGGAELDDETTIDEQLATILNAPARIHQPIENIDSSENLQISQSTIVHAPLPEPIPSQIIIEQAQPTQLHNTEPSNQNQLEAESFIQAPTSQKSEATLDFHGELEIKIKNRASKYLDHTITCDSPSYQVKMEEMFNRILKIAQEAQSALLPEPITPEKLNDLLNLEKIEQEQKKNLFAGLRTFILARQKKLNYSLLESTLESSTHESAENELVMSILDSTFGPATPQVTPTKNNVPIPVCALTPENNNEHNNPALTTVGSTSIRTIAQEMDLRDHIPGPLELPVASRAENSQPTQSLESSWENI